MGKRKARHDTQDGAHAASQPGSTPRDDQFQKLNKVQLREQQTGISDVVGELDLGFAHSEKRQPAAKTNTSKSTRDQVAGQRQSVAPMSKEGHRNRLRARFRDGGEDAVPDYELLELVLFRAIPRRDTKDLAKRLLARFKTFAEVVNAPEQRLKELPGVGDSVVTELKLVRAAALRMMKSQINEKPLLSSWSAVLEYVKAAQAYENQEIFRILFLDKRNRLIADEIQGRGTVDHTPVYIREVVKRALELSATAIILVHNHPSGDPTPSRADIDMTRLIAEAARPLGVAVHDHIIVGREGHASLKALKLI